MNKTVYEFNDYKAYVLSLIDEYPGGSRGVRRRLADFMNCQVAYVSHVLAAERHFSLEQAEALTRFFSLREDEATYFLLLVEHQRAGTQELKGHIQRQLNRAKADYQEIKNRIRINRQISEEDQAHYYSSWHFQAIHTLLTIPEFRNPATISDRLKLSPDRVNQVLSFLFERGLIKQENGQYLPTEMRIHLPRTSPLISKLHSNWRTHTLSHLADMNKDDFLYSGVITLSHIDAQKVKEILIKALENTIQIVEPSKEEEIYLLAIDYYQL